VIISPQNFHNCTKIWLSEIMMSIWNHICTWCNKRALIFQGERNFNRFGGWLGKNSTMGKNYRLLEDMHVHLLASRGSNLGRFVFHFHFFLLLYLWSQVNSVFIFYWQAFKARIVVLVLPFSFPLSKAYIHRQIDA